MVCCSEDGSWLSVVPKDESQHQSTVCYGNLLVSSGFEILRGMQELLIGDLKPNAKDDVERPKYSEHSVLSAAC